MWKVEEKNMKKNFQPFEFGRSMVEMLAVLAVIGILSMAGILFYRQAMIKHDATNIYGQIGLANAQMLVKKSPTIQQPPKATITTPAVSGVGNDAFIKVEMDNAAICKEVESMYKNNVDFVVVSNCDDED